MKRIDKTIITEIRLLVPQLFIVLLLMFGSIVFQALSPWSFKILLDEVLGFSNSSENTTVSFLSFLFTRESLGYIALFIFFASSILVNLFDYFQLILLKSTLRNIIHNLATKVFNNLELFGMKFFKQHETGDYIYRLDSDIYAVSSLIENGILPVITSSIYLIITVVIMFFIHVQLTLIALAALPFLVGGMYVLNNKIVAISKKSERANSTVYSFIQQALTQLAVIQAFHQEKAELRKYDTKVTHALGYDFRLDKLNAILSLIIGLLIAINYTAIIGYGIREVFNNALTTGLLIVFIFYLDNLTNPVLSIIYAISSFKENHVKINRLADFFNSHAFTTNTGTLTHIENFTIEFKDVDLYDSPDNRILQNINLTIAAGTVTVLIGMSGSGKSSLLSLLPRFIEPSSGHILLGDHPITDYTLETLRNNISYVPQDIYLFNDTIRNIISFGRPEATFKEIQHAARLAYADEFIENHPHGYDFRVGEGGVFLSGGQRQRLMIARAFLKNAPIVIFDEPLSSLDLETRTKVWKNIQEFCIGKTAIIISNILDVVTSGDTVVVLENGKVLTTGKSHDLLSNKKIYNVIYRMNKA